MWYYDSQTIKTPKVMVIGSGSDAITHPKGIFNDSSMLTSLGIKPYSEVKPDETYYYLGALTVDASGAEVVGTYAGIAKTVSSLKADMLGKINAQVASRLGLIDWYWARADKGGTAVPSNIATYATTIYSEQATKESEVAALDTLAKIIEYEGRAYTRVEKVKLYDGDGVFTGYHASNTISTSESMNMLMHWTVNPNEVDAGLVSLTAD